MYFMTKLLNKSLLNALADMGKRCKVSVKAYSFLNKQQKCF